MSKAKYTLWDTFNDAPLSRHRTIEAAAKAKVSNDRYWARNGNGSYIPTAIRRTDGEPMTEAEMTDAEQAVYRIECDNR